MTASAYQPPLNPISQACDGFLPNLFNPTVGLLAATPGTSSYYVASDNLLYLKAFDLTCYEGHPSLADLIRSIISLNSCCNEANDSMHQAVAGLPIPLPIHSANFYNITSTWRPLSCCPSPGNHVYYENHNGTAILSDAQYGDVAAYTTLELEREGNHTAALHEIALLKWMYDGRGIVDDVYKYSTAGERGVYKTFKDALYMLALAKTGQWIPPSLEKTILSMQGEDGGFHTGYDSTGNYTGTKENVETTTLAMIALHSLPAHIHIEPYPFHNMTGTGQVRTVKVVPFIWNEENWTVTVNLTVYWDNSTILVGNQTFAGLLPVWQYGGPGAVFSHNVTFDPTLPHFLRIYAGNSSLILPVYSPPSAPASPPWWNTYWYVFLIPTIALVVLSGAYRLKHSRGAVRNPRTFWGREVDKVRQLFPRFNSLTDFL